MIVLSAYRARDLPEIGLSNAVCMPESKQVQVARHVGVRAPIARLSFPRIPLNVKPLDPLRARPRASLATAATARRTGTCCGAVAGTRVAAQRTRRAAAAVVLLRSRALSLSLSVRPERTYRSFRRPYKMCGCALDEWHPRYYSLHSEAASSGKELLGRLSLWRVQVDRGHRPLGAVVGLAPPARLCRGSRAVSRELPTGQLPTGAL